MQGTTLVLIKSLRNIEDCEPYLETCGNDRIDLPKGEIYSKIKSFLLLQNFANCQNV